MAKLETLVLDRDKVAAELAAQLTGNTQITTANLEMSTYKEVGYLCDVFGLEHRTTALKLLEVLHVPLFYLGRSCFFNSLAFEAVLHVLTRYGGPGFAAPGSEFKARGRHKTTHVPIEVTDEILQQAAEPRTLLTLLAAGAKDKMALREIAKQTAIPEQKDAEKPEQEPQ